MKKSLAILISYLFPVLVFAQAAPGLRAGEIGEKINIFRQLLSVIPNILLAFAIIYFMFGLVKYLMNAGDAGNRGEAIEIMLWGGIAIFVMVSIVSIIGIVQRTFGIQGREVLSPPPVALLDSHRA